MTVPSLKIQTEDITSAYFIVLGAGERQGTYSYEEALENLRAHVGKGGAGLMVLCDRVVCECGELLWLDIGLKSCFCGRLHRR